MSRTHLATVLIASAAGAVAGGVAATLVSQCSLESTAAEPADDARLAALRREHDELSKQVAELRSGQDLLASRPDRAVASAFPSAGSPPAALPAALPAAAPAAPIADEVLAAEAAPTVESLLAKLLEPGLTYGDSLAIWEQANKAGLLDAIVQAMEERAEREPNNPDLKVELGNAYLQKLSAVGDLAKGKWASKADRAYDAALELDPQHWEARFTKAVSLSHWPAFLGKQGLAIAEFKTLIAQQSTVPQEPHFAETYVYLGGMYLSSGEKAKALETWQQGAALFPNDQALKQRIEQNQ